MLIELSAPTLRPNVLITPLFEILVVFVTPSVAVPPTFKALLIEALPPTPSVNVLI